MRIEAVASRLGEIMRGQVRTNEPMSYHTSFRIGGPADVFVIPRDVLDLKACLDFLRGERAPFLVIGNGTNILVADEGIRGIVIKIGGALRDVDITDGQIIAGAGAGLPYVSRVACERGLSGLEFATGIPGSLGGAVFMNAGAYGRAMQDVVVSCEVITPEGDFKTYERDYVGFRPRGSRFEESREVIVAVTLRLEPGDREAIRRELESLARSREEKQPLEYPSAGCVFKNPAGGGAGRYIDWAGLKGLRIGDAQVSHKHANFVVNLGRATCKDVLELMDVVASTVGERFGVVLRPEIRVIGPQLDVPWD
ncbi:MAG TPA: UDP-N-acetylmuramate dehydrogenase [Firmicutes bacterium]|nr:UDP-N-acetylmuramate dehydrogenase [Bacillota bacterium]